MEIKKSHNRLKCGLFTTQLVPLQPIPVDIWRIDLTRDRAPVLSVAEIARANRFRFESDRERWSRAHSALRQVLSRYTGMAPLELAFATGPHGKPFFEHCSAAHFNLSHSGDWALVAVCLACPVGVDVERIRARVDIKALLERLGETDLPALRNPLFQRWANREARSKACGGPLMTPPPSGAVAVPLDVAPGYAAAVALMGFAPAPQYRTE